MTEETCCTDAARTFSRRGVLLSALGVGAAGATTSMFGDTFRSVAYAATPPGNNVVVVVSMRGAIDGMGIAVPHGEAAYYKARPTIAIPRNTLFAADSMFGLHPALKPLEKYWKAKTFGVVNATGLTRPNRSHFAAMEAVEDAESGSLVRQGWVNRLLGDSGDALKGVHLTSTSAPTLISGDHPTVAAQRLNGIYLAGANPATDHVDWRPRRRSSLKTLWKAPDGDVPAELHNRLAGAVTQAANLTESLGSVTMGAPRNGAAYDKTWRGEDFGEALADTANLIRADVGTVAVTLDCGQWDYHNSYGTLTSGKMAVNLAAFAKNMDAFMTDLGSEMSRVTIVVMSEFGRRLGQNGAGGLDHGWGNVMLTFGAGVRGGEYLGRWPGLTGSGNTLVDDDVAVTTDYRQVLNEIVTHRFPDLSSSQVFPGLKVERPGVMRA